MAAAIPEFVSWLFLTKRSTRMKLFHHKEAGLRRALTLDLERRSLPPRPSPKTVAEPLKLREPDLIHI